jgi:hypothetical protein
VGRPKKSVAKHIEPEYESQDVPDEEPASVIETEPVAAQPTMSKADACRAALAAGIETTEEAMEFTLKKFGVEIKATDFTLYKSKAKAAAAAPKSAPAKRGRKPKAAETVARKPLVEGYVAPPEKPKAAGELDVLLALEGVKELVGQFGADQVKRMVDLIS